MTLQRRLHPDERGRGAALPLRLDLWTLVARLPRDTGWKLGADELEEHLVTAERALARATAPSDPA